MENDSSIYFTSYFNTRFMIYLNLVYMKLTEQTAAGLGNDDW